VDRYGPVSQFPVKRVPDPLGTAFSSLKVLTSAASLHRQWRYF